MRYLIIAKGFPPAITKWFDPDNHFNKSIEMIVFDLYLLKYMDDGVTWKEIEEDHL